jgi:tRNA U34 5-methylaminomethyl-2-thiouridine-forming methyltransferase MnmC
MRTWRKKNTWRKKDQPPSRRFQDSYLAQKGSTTKPPVPGCAPGAKRINHQAASSRTRTWRKKDQPPSRQFQDASLADWQSVFRYV